MIALLFFFLFSFVTSNCNIDKIWHRAVQKEKWPKDKQNLVFSFFALVCLVLG